MYEGHLKKEKFLPMDKLKPLRLRWMSHVTGSWYYVQIKMATIMLKKMRYCGINSTTWR